MLNRSALAIGATALAGLAALAAAVDGDADILPFFIALTTAGGVGAVAVRDPYTGGRRLIARTIGVAWLLVGGYIGLLLLWYQTLCGCSFPAPVEPEATYLGLTATAYHLAGVFGGGVLMAVSAFSRALDRSGPAGS